MSLLSGTGRRTLLIAAVLFLSVILRLRGLTARSLWFDEASAWAAVTQFTPAELLESCRQNVHPPVWHFLLKSWVSVFGDSLAALRGLSVLSGVAAVGCGMGLAAESARNILRPNGRIEAALAAGVLLATSPLQIIWSQQSRMYMLGSLLTLASSWLLLIALRRQLWLAWLAYAVAAFLLLHTHNFGMFVVAGQAVYVLGATVSDSRKIRSERPGHPGATTETDANSGLVMAGSWRRARGIIVLVLVGVSFLPWLQVVRQQTARVQADYWIWQFEFNQVANIAKELFLPVNSERITALLPGGFEWMFVALICSFLCAAVVLRLAVLPAVVAAASFGCAILVSMFVTPLMVTRYFQFGQIILLVAIALAAVQIPQRRWRMSTVGILVVLSVATVWLLPSKADLAKRPGLSALVRKVLSQRQNDESVLVASPYMFHATRFHVQHSSGGDNNVQVILIRNNRQLLHYSGGPVIRPTAILLPMELDQGTLSSAWLINVAEFSPWMEDVALSPVWHKVAQTQLREDEDSGVRCVVTAERIVRE